MSLPGLGYQLLNQREAARTSNRYHKRADNRIYRDWREHSRADLSELIGNLGVSLDGLFKITAQSFTKTRAAQCRFVRHGKARFGKNRRVPLKELFEFYNQRAFVVLQRTGVRKIGFQPCFQARSIDLLFLVFCAYRSSAA